MLHKRGAFQKNKRVNNVRIHLFWVNYSFKIKPMDKLFMFQYEAMAEYQIQAYKKNERRAFGYLL